MCSRRGGILRDNVAARCCAAQSCRAGQREDARAARATESAAAAAAGGTSKYVTNLQLSCSLPLSLSSSIARALAVSPVNVLLHRNVCSLYGAYVHFSYITVTSLTTYY